MSSTSLTERYVWTVTRHLPPETGPDVARELRGTIEETVEGRVAGGEDPVTAERETILGLGDPAVLAREYGGRPNHLIGPAYFPAWVRLVKLLLAVVVPLVALGTVLAHAFGTDAGVGAIVGEAAGTAVQVAVHIIFWTAVVFAVVERYGGAAERDKIVDTWSPDELADPADRMSVSEMIGEVVFTVILIVLVVWQLRGVEEGSLQVLDPGLGLGWGALIVGPLVLDVLVTVAAWARGGWTLLVATASLVSAVVYGVVLVWLLLAGRLLTDLPRELEATFGWEGEWRVSVPAVAVGIILVCGWEAVTALRRMRDARRHPQA